MRLATGFTAVLAAFVVSTACQAEIISVNLGTVAPPATLGGYTMVPFAADPSAVLTATTSLNSPIAGTLDFSVAMEHRKVGNGWMTWSHGYTGDVYYSAAVASLTLTLPAETSAFYFYAEPNQLSLHSITATASDGTQLSIPVLGNAGAAGFGFYATPGQYITSISVTSPVAFGIGEFGIASEPLPEPEAMPVPEPTSLVAVGMMALVGAGVSRLRRRSAK